MVRVGDQGRYRHAALGGGLQRLLDLDAIEAEDDDIDLLPGLLDRRHEGADSGRRLNEKFH
jgi:hypothetical protein